MANVQDAISFVLNQEDARMSGVVTNTPGDPGGATRLGISSRWHPELKASGFFDPTRVDRDQALVTAMKVYTLEYAAALQIPRIANQNLANRLLSFAVNEGRLEAVSLLQKALRASGWKNLIADGVLGERTIAGVNLCDPATVLEYWRMLQKVYYAAWVAEDAPARAGLLKGLLNRAAA